MAKLQHEEWPTEKLIDYARNPRDNDGAVDRMCANIREFGFLVPVVAKSDGSVVDGHLRLKAARKLNLETVPVVLADNLTDIQIKAFRLAVNKASEWALWNDELLTLELEELDEAGFELDLLGFDEDELDELMQDDEPNSEGLTDEDSVPEVPEKPVSQLGDIWILGNHRLMCGDSTDAGSVALLMDGIKVDMVYCDPPYGMQLEADYSSYTGSGNSKRHGLDAKKHDNVKGDHSDFSPKLIKTIFENFSECKEMFLWGGDYYAELLQGKNEGSWVVWDKTGGHESLVNAGFSSNFELCWSKVKHKRVIAPITYKGVAGMKKEDGKRVHPTQKPVGLAEWFFDEWGGKTKTVVDLYLGSGSTLLACEKTNRHCYGMELDPRYCDIVISRFQDFTGTSATLEGTDKRFSTIAEERNGNT